MISQVLNLVMKQFLIKTCSPAKSQYIQRDVARYSGTSQWFLTASPPAFPPDYSLLHLIFPIV